MRKPQVEIIFNQSDTVKHSQEENKAAVAYRKCFMSGIAIIMISEMTCFSQPQYTCMIEENSHEIHRSDPLL